MHAISSKTTRSPSMVDHSMSYYNDTTSIYADTNYFTHVTYVHYQELTGVHGNIIRLGWRVPKDLVDDIMLELAHVMNKQRTLEQTCQRLAVLGWTADPTLINYFGNNVLKRAGL